MTMRWLECSGGNVHLVGPCPECPPDKGGLLVGTVSSSYKGRVTAKCVDCDAVLDYYVDAQEGKVWRLELIDARGVVLSR